MTVKSSVARLVFCIALTAAVGAPSVSPEGRVYDIKGVKTTNDRIETTILNVPIHAHVKALPPAGDI